MQFVVNKTYQSNMTSKMLHQTLHVVKQIQRLIVTVLTNKTLERRFTWYMTVSNMFLTLNRKLKYHQLLSEFGANFVKGKILKVLLLQTN